MKSNIDNNISLFQQIGNHLEHEENIKIAINFLENVKHRQWMTPSRNVEAMVRIYMELAQGDNDAAIKIGRRDLDAVREDINSLALKYKIGTENDK